MLRPRCAAPGLLAALAAVISGEAIRLPSSDEKAVALRGAPPRRQFTTSAQCSVGVPKVSMFSESWKKRMQNQPPPHPGEDGPEEDRPVLVVGVFSTARCQDRPYRDVIRSTWMAQKGVCPLGRLAGPQAGCSLHVTFVLGQDGHGDDEAGAEDMTVLPIPENMNCGKTPAWFQFASTTYPWATHIVKMDMDAFPYVHEIMFSIRTRSPSCPNVMGGRSVKNPLMDPEDERHGGYPMSADLSNFLLCQPPASSRCYMQGGLYLLTTELARNVSAPGDWWQEFSKKCNPEDQTTGRAVFRFGNLSNVCVGALRFENEREYWHPR